MESVFIIAEIAQAHDGSLGILHSYIDAVSKTGANAVKFQTHIAHAESSEFEPFRVKFSKQDNTRFDYWKRMEFSREQWKGIKEHCDEVGLEFMSSPFSIEAVELLEALGMKRYKIASGEMQNFLMLDRICRTGKPIILSSGMSSYEEIERTIGFVSQYGNDVTLLQCTTSYPVPPESIGLNNLSEYTKRFNVPVGLSDHSGTIYPSLAAVTLGASMIEVHVTFSKDIFGPDTKASLTFDEMKMLVDGSKFISTALQNPVNKTDNSEFNEIQKIFGKTLSVRKDLKKGDIIMLEDLESKKPAGMGIPASHYAEVVGKKLIKNVDRGSFLNNIDLRD